LRALFLILILFVQIAMPAVAGLNADGSLDRAKISKAYFEGDFDLVVEALETFRKIQPNPTREDKIYIYKYLSVIYAAKPETRGKAESYMYQLLKIMPSIELMDLYISDNIESIFNTVRVRFEQQQRLGTNPGQGNPPAPAREAAPASAPPRKPVPVDPRTAGEKRKAGKESSSSWVWWTVGGVGIAAAVAGFVFLSDPSKSPSASSDTVDLK
jgi:hypothetical protein